jgi:Bacteriophage protein of unknown function (DUF646).
MATFEEAMQRVIDTAESVSTKMPVEDRAKVTRAGAKAFKQALTREVRNRHYRHRETGEDPHLAEDIVMQSKNIDGVKDGQSVVGWEKSNVKGTHTKGYIAHIINNGSRIPQFTTRSGRKYKTPGAVAIHADHFIEETRENPIVKEMVLNAESEAMRKIINRRNKQ